MQVQQIVKATLVSRYSRQILSNKSHTFSYVIIKRTVYNSAENGTYSAMLLLLLIYQFYPFFCLGEGNDIEIRQVTHKGKASDLKQEESYISK